MRKHPCWQRNPPLFRYTLPLLGVKCMPREAQGEIEKHHVLFAIVDRCVIDEEYSPSVLVRRAIILNIETLLNDSFDIFSHCKSVKTATNPL